MIVFERCLLGDGCWEWQGGKDGCGYGQINFGGRHLKAHRVAYAAFNGIPIESIDKCVLHKCDNPGCVRPDHLFLGTQKDNAIDRERKQRGRDSRGENSGQNVLTQEQVECVLLDSRSHAVIARELGVSKGTVAHIRQGRSWKHVPRTGSKAA